MDSGLDLSTANDMSIQRYTSHLCLILHAHKCLKQETQTTNNNNNCTTTSQNLCTVPNCKGMQIVLQHMTECENFDNCSFPQCVQSRSIVSHRKNCTTPDCRICSSIPKNTLKEWQQSINRNDLIEMIIPAILDIIKNNIPSSSSNELDKIRNHAQEIETDAFNTATNKEDYFQQANNQLLRIQENYKIELQQATVDQSLDAQGPLVGNSYSSSTPTTVISKHTDNDYIVSDGVDRITHDNYNSTIHTGANRSHADTTIMEIDDAASNDNTKSQMATTDKQLCTTNKVLVNDRNMVPTTTTTTTSTVEMNENEEKALEVDTLNRALQNGATSESLPKHPATFSSTRIRKKMAPILRDLYKLEDSFWFREPVTETDAPGYFKRIEHPMDFSTISKKLDENEYTTPFQFLGDMWLVFNNAWTYNKKTDAVYEAASTLAKKFMKLVDPIMKEYGYCCGGQYVFLAPAMFCYGDRCKCCTIPHDGDYFIYNNSDSSRNNLSGDKYTFCKKCFKSVKSKCISVGDDPTQTLVKIPKTEFHQAKNDHQEQEAMVDCIVCSRRFHNICVLYHERIWTDGYVCKLCVQKYNIKQKNNRYLACKLPTTRLSDALEERVNTFLQTERDANKNHVIGRVTIRVLAAYDRVCEVKPKFKEYFGAEAQKCYPYRTKAIFAFQEIEGVDVVLFGMYVQEYGNECPAPNTNRVYISYLDSVHYFKPTDKRTTLYYEILIGYLEYVKQLGFVYAHIWACPPKHGDDYIFHCHPAEQRMPTPEHLQKWYENMLKKAEIQRVALPYKDIIKDLTDSDINNSTDIPYFEGDCWPSQMEELIENRKTTKASFNKNLHDSSEPEEPTESRKKRKLRNETTYMSTNQGQNNKKNKTNKDDIFSKITTLMEKDKASFFVVHLRDPGTLTDTDPLIQCDLMESRDAFLSFARDKHCEFSSLRRAKYSTMVSLIELHSSTVDKISYTCNLCEQQCDIRYHCTVCEDYDLCLTCYTPSKHEHRMERSDETNETTTNSDTPVNIQQQRQIRMQQMLEVLLHAVQCRTANCIFKNCSPYKRLIQHTKECTKALSNQCLLCSKSESIWFHATTCVDRDCPLPYCKNCKIMIQRQRAKAMEQAKMKPGSSTLNSQMSEPTTTTSRFTRSIEEAIPNSTDKIMPSDSKKRKSLLINRLVQNPLPQQFPSQAEPVITTVINNSSSGSQSTLLPLSSSVISLPVEKN